MGGQSLKVSMQCTRAVFLTLAVLSLFGCVTVGGREVRTMLDPATAVTATMLPSALEFTSNTLTVEPAARIDAQIGPVEVNRSGVYYYLLWVSAERADHRGERRAPSVRILDGNRVLLERLAKDALGAAPLSIVPYSTDLDPSSQYTYELSEADLRALKIDGRLGLSVSFDDSTWHLLDRWEGASENFNQLIASAFPAQ
jgi:hypothetical protein